MNRVCVHILLLSAAGLCPVVPGCAHHFGLRSYPTPNYSTTVEKWNARVREPVVVPDDHSEQHESGDRDNGSMAIGIWLLSGQIDQGPWRGFRCLEYSAVGALISSGLTFAGFLYWKRRNLRRRIWSLRISPEALHERINSGNAPLIVDLRSPLDMLPDPRMIPGAVRLTQEEVPVEAAAMALPRDGDIVLYCTCPREKSSIDTALALLNAGFSRVRLLSGGFQAWKQLGYELQNAADMIRWPSQTTALSGDSASREHPAKA